MESDQVAWADSEVGPDVDDMLRQLDLDRNIEDLVPVDPISQEGLPDDPEQWARAVAALWQTPDQDLLPWEEALESQSSGPPSILLVPEMPPDQPTLAPPPVAARDQVWLEALTWQESSGQKEPAAATPQSQPPAGTERFTDLRGDNADTWTLDATPYEAVAADRCWDIYWACLAALAIGGLPCRAGGSNAGDEYQDQEQQEKR